MAKYKLTNKAVDDLTKIWDYTFDNWSEKQADKYYAMLLENCNTLQMTRTSEKIIPELARKFSG